MKHLTIIIAFLMAFGIQVNAGGYFIHDSNIYAEDLRSIKSVYVAIADFSDGNCWTSLKEATR
jgi:hypothetical protein